MTSFTLYGIPVSRGIAIGRAHLLAPVAMDVKHYLIGETEVEAEVSRLQNAVVKVRTDLQVIRAHLPKDSPPEVGAFVDVHLLILHDPMLADMSLDIIRNRRYNAEWALVTQINKLSAQFDEIEDTYLRERKVDVLQVGERLLKVLTGSCSTKLPEVCSDSVSFANIIVVAYNISPADMLQFRDRAFSGFITDLGGRNSHTAIVARSLDIPAAVGVNNASRLIKQDDWIIIDGDAGVIIADPATVVLEQYREYQKKLLRLRRKLSKIKKLSTITLDGTKISLLANIELPSDCAAVVESGAHGIGLFRSEFLFMNYIGSQHRSPNEEEQFTSYREAVVAMKGRPITIRTIDIGADKPIHNGEETALKPALGLRAIRYCLAEPQIFLTQLRAILRASVFGEVKILIPMLVHAFEIDQALAMITKAKQQLYSNSIAFDSTIKIGAMIEIPAAALALPMFIKRVDFLSIGTNDLIQYALAVDRVDHEVAHLYNPLHPAILYMLSNIIVLGRKAGIPVSVCGEMAGDIKFTRLLLGMGLREFSMHSSQLLSVKQEILSSNLDKLIIQTKKILRITEPSMIVSSVRKMRTAP